MSINTTARTVGSVPTATHITGYQGDLTMIGADCRYAYAFGVLRWVIEKLADDHGHCTEPNCRTCRKLRYGLALVAAMKETRASAGGAR